MLQSYNDYLNYLTPSILELQKQVANARDKMQYFQQNLTNQFQELKKIEKLIHKKRNHKGRKREKTGSYSNG